MTDRTASTTLATRPRVRRASRSHPGWGLRRIQPDWWPLPTMEEVEARLRSYPGFFASLTPEQRAIMDAWDGPEVMGDPNGPKRKF
jgi:hypothetical protein